MFQQLSPCNGPLAHFFRHFKRQRASDRSVNDYAIFIHYLCMHSFDGQSWLFLSDCTSWSISNSELLWFLLLFRVFRVWNLHFRNSHKNGMRIIFWGDGGIEDTDLNYILNILMILINIRTVGMTRSGNKLRTNYIVAIYILYFIIKCMIQYM